MSRAGAAKAAPRTPVEALRRLVIGNEVFAGIAEKAARGEGVVVELEPDELGLASTRGVAPTQRPFAAVLGCADARVPVEMVFQQRSNDLFVVRVAGNGIGLGGLGSFRYAAAHFADSLRLVVVLGHSQCGAVTAAVDAFLLPRSYLSLAGDYPLRSLVDGILVAVRAASLALERAHGRRVTARPGYRAALVESSVILNAAFAAFSLERELRTRRCRVVFGRYDLASARLGLPLGAGAAARAGAGLVAPPQDGEGFRRLAEELAASPQLRALLAGPRALQTGRGSRDKPRP
jgi:carbonic anhydrase